MITVGCGEKRHCGNIINTKSGKCRSLTQSLKKVTGWESEPNALHHLLICILYGPVENLDKW